jgi:parallel beta-helix repeat protein
MPGSSYSIIEDCIISNYRSIAGALQDGIGINMLPGSFNTIKDNVLFQNHLGMSLIGIDNCIIDGNIFSNNGNDPAFGGFPVGAFPMGFLTGPGDTVYGLPINGDIFRQNQFYRNYFNNNGQAGATNVVDRTNFPAATPLPYLLTAPFNGLAPFAEYANVQSQPTIWMIQSPFAFLPPAIIAGSSLTLAVYILVGNPVPPGPWTATLTPANPTRAPLVNVVAPASGTITTFVVPAMQLADAGPYTVSVSFPGFNTYTSNTVNVRVASVATTITAASNGQLLPQSTINVVSTAGFPTSGTIVINLGNNGEYQRVTYTGITPTSFTGASGGQGTLVTGDAVYYPAASTATAAASAGLNLPQPTINVVSTLTFPTSGTLTVVTTAGPQTVTYTGITPTSFTGTAGGTGTMVLGNPISLN